MRYIVKVNDNNRSDEYLIENGKNILDFLRENSYDVSTPCGGKGTCGKCKIKVEGYIKEPSEKEKRLLGTYAESNDLRLACFNVVEGDLEISLNSFNKEANIVTKGIEKSFEIFPIIEKRVLELDTPNISDQRSDVDRVAQVFNPNSVIHSIKILQNISETIRENYLVTVVAKEEKILGIEQGNTKGNFYGIAVDIGTTTIAAYLYNLNTGDRVDVYSALNPQSKYGADVLSRIEYTNKSSSNQFEMHMLIIECLNNIIKVFTKKNNITKENIYSMVFAGNTTMVHFLMNLPAKYLAISPFIPVTTNMHYFEPCELGLDISNNGLAIVLPCVSAYIGADTISAVLSTDINKSDDICLLVDIGTNGEIVLGNKDWMYSCSTAAGPAFEGANIQYGIGGIKGAIDKVYFDDKLKYHTIGSEKPIGICGSGIVDAVAVMIDKNIIDETGRIISKSEYITEYILENDTLHGNENHKSRDKLSYNYAKHLVEINGMNSFILAKREETGINSDIVITQKDIRELQNAKAAIAAGIKTLIKQARISGKDIKKIYLAGGFGNYIQVSSAFRIGLLPSNIDEDRVVAIGNAAGAGAIEGLLSKYNLYEMETIKDKIKYIELSAMLDFRDEYVNCMFFE